MSDLYQDPLPVRMVADDPSKPEVLFERALPVVLVNDEEGGSEVDDTKIAALINDPDSQTAQALAKFVADNPTTLG